MKANGNNNILKNWKVLVGIFAVILLILLCIGVYYSQIRQEEKNQELIALDLEEKEAAKVAYNNINESYQEVVSVVSNYLPGIICWGDSLTAGAGGDAGYPVILSQLILENISESLDFSARLNENRKLLMSESDYTLLIPVENMGVGGENVSTILGRNGAIPFLL